MHTSLFSSVPLCHMLSAAQDVNDVHPVMTSLHCFRSRSRSPPAKKGRHQQAQPRGRRHSSTTSSSSSSPGRRSPRSSSSSMSPVRRTLRQSRRSPSRSRHRGRRSPSPRARPRSARSPRAKGRSQRSPSRRPQRRAGASGRSPARHDRQRKPAQAGGSTTPSSSRSPSPVRRRAPPGNPLPSRAGDRHRPRIRRSSPVQQANTGQDRTAPSRKSQDIAPLAVEPTIKPHHGSAQPAVLTAAAADTNGQLPPPPDRASAAQGPALPPAPALPLPPPPQQEQRDRAVSPKPVQAPKYAAAQALVGPKKKLVPAQQEASSVAPPATAAAATAAQRDLNLLYVVEDREPLPQRLPSKPTELAAGNVTKTATALAPPAVASDSASVRPAVARDSTAADSINNKSSQSFDGKQSFISLNVEDAPVTGPPSIEQPSLAAAQAAPKADAQDDAGKKARPETQPTQQAEPMDLDSANPSTSAANLPALNQVHLLGAAPTPASTTAGGPAAAAAEADARAIRPDLLSGSSQSRPASAASQGLAAAEFSEAETGQKLLAASRSKAAGKGNIQIVLATKHKQVQAFIGCSCELSRPCAYAVLCMKWCLLSSQPDGKTSVPLLRSWSML